MKKLSILVVLLMLVFSATSVYAVPEGYYSPEYLGLYLDDGAGNTALVLSDNGFANFNGVLGNWIINVTTAITYPFLGSQDSPLIDLNSVNVTSTGGGTLSIYASASGFSELLSDGSFAFDIGGTTSGTVQFKAYWDYEPDYLFWLNQKLADSGVVGFSPFAIALSGIVPAGAVDYTIFAQIVHSEGGATSFDAEFSVAVPEPATMLLLGSGLVGLAGIGRRKFFKK